MMYKLMSNSAKGLQTHLRARQCHVHSYQRGIPFRGLHTEIDELSSPVEAIPITSPKKRLPFRLRQVTLSVEQNSNEVTVQQVVDALLKFRREPKLLEKLPKHQAVVILATPNFASWLEASSEFIPKALQRIVGTANSTEVDVVCACVDGLAPRPKWIRLMDHDTANREGFAILHLTENYFSDIWENRSAALKSPSMQSTLTFMTERTKNNVEIAVTLPLANTLFKTGRHSTLLVSRWRSSGDSFLISKEQTEKHNVNLPVFGRLPSGLLRTHIPTVGLTPIRRITNGLGNIVRRIEFGEGDVGPASRELETRITEYLAQQRDGRSTIDVWALIIPRDAFSGKENESEKDSMAEGKDVRGAWRSKALSSQYISNWLDKGATLCRVLSGGGGWGPKQGLLSLDPQTTYRTVNESWFDFSEGSPDEQQVSALGNIAQEGSFIQFLVAAQNKGASAKLKIKNQRRIDWWGVSTVVGAVPSTVDGLNGRSQEKQLDKGKPKDSVQVYVGQFGCVSESGIFLHRPLDIGRPGMSMIKTKLDLPYSYIYRDHVKKRGQLGIDKDRATGG